MTSSDEHNLAADGKANNSKIIILHSGEVETTPALEHAQHIIDSDSDSDSDTDSAVRNFTPKADGKKLSMGFILQHPARFIACGFGSGLSPVAPGTVGTLFAWWAFELLYPLFTISNWLIFLLICCFAGMVIIHQAGKDFGDADHKSIVWDEIVPFWLVLTLCPPTWLWQFIAFMLFRFFDITKPQPARFFDQQMKNGFGVMADDLVAAAYTLLVLALLLRIF